MLNGSEFWGQLLFEARNCSMQQLSFGRQLSSPSDASGMTSKHRLQPAKRRKRSSSYISFELVCSQAFPMGPVPSDEQG